MVAPVPLSRRRLAAPAVPPAPARPEPGLPVDLALAELPTPALLRMAEAGRTVLETTRMLARSGRTLAMLMSGAASFGAERRGCWHAETVTDAESGARFLFHRHTDAGPDEAGHFHCFAQVDGAPPEADGPRPLQRGNGLAHIVAVAIDRQGLPISLFTTNRWVTDETWQPAPLLRRLADRFAVNAPGPLMAAGLWLGAALRLFRAEIAALLAERDQAIGRQLAAFPDRDPFEDRAFAEPSRMAISVETQIARLRAELAARR